MHQQRRRKKRPNYGVHTVEVCRGPSGFGFTISGQRPCILSCIVPDSPADHAGLRAGDFLISVNGISVSKVTHDVVAKLIGNSVGKIKIAIVEHYYSDSSDEELETSRVISNRKSKYIKSHVSHKSKPDDHVHVDGIAIKSGEANKAQDVGKNVCVGMQEFNSIDYKIVLGYVGTIEMPKQVPPTLRFQTVCGCIRKLRQEKRTPTTVLMVVMPACLMLKSVCNQILAVYPSNRVNYISSCSEKESRYFGLVTTAVTECDDVSFSERWNTGEKPSEMSISSSCHIFVIDTKLIEHSQHLKYTQSFKISCTSDIVTGSCLEFPRSASYVVSLVQNMFRLQDSYQESKNFNDNVPMANSPQPSASSNSDSGIGFRDDSGNVSDRILVVEFPAQRSLHINEPSSSRPCAIDGNVIPIEISPSWDVKNVRAKPDYEPKNDIKSNYSDNLNNIRAFEPKVDVKDSPKTPTSDPYGWDKRLTVRAMPNPLPITPPEMDVNYEVYEERPVDVPEQEVNSKENDYKSSVDNISLHSSKSFDLASLKSMFKSQAAKSEKKLKQFMKLGSCENLTPAKSKNSFDSKLASKVFGATKPTFSCEELCVFENDKHNFGSLQELCTWNNGYVKNGAGAVSEPDVRLCNRDGENEDKSGSEDCTPMLTSANWESSFEKLLEDPLGLQTFTEFLKKEFSAENIYFWNACERYKKLPAGPERATEAQCIYQRHLCIGASEPVNVDSQGRQFTRQALQEADSDLFEQAQKQIFKLMKFDSYPRFLKSDLCKQSLAERAARAQQNASMLFKPLGTTPSKLKKSLSNAEDRRRKSLLPWHRKNRSKSKDRDETEYSGQKSNEDETGEEANAQDIHSSKSSLTSLDLAMMCSMHDDFGQCTRKLKGALCKVILSNLATTVVQIRPEETIREMIIRLLDKRGHSYSAFEVYISGCSKSVDLNEPSSTLIGCEVTIEQRIVFKIDLPNHKVISVKSKISKLLIDVLRPILNKYGYVLDNVSVTVSPKLGEGSCDEYVDIWLPVSSVDGCRLRIHLHDGGAFHSVPSASTVPQKTKLAIPTLDEITNRVFEELLYEKSTAKYVPTSDRGSVKSEDWSSEHSSKIFGRFFRHDSGTFEKRKKNRPTHGSNNREENVNGIENEQVTKKPLIAKWMTGARLQMTCSENDELYEGLKRAQRSRIEDQRGTEINFELPDFLKYKENLPGGSLNLDEEGTSEDSSGYEADKTVIKASDINKPLSPQPPVACRNFQNYSGNYERTKAVEPPPLPPKPKVLPMRPSNWSQNGVFKVPNGALKSDHSRQNIYLEQPTSSFV